ncbi:MAG: 3-methyl-2-oxobutanoate hydroxymethyltransferase, partial [cyanobacterium endosymbiont of Rhopalodia yunnanensis]
MAITLQCIIEAKRQGRLLTVLTAWDYAIAQLLDIAGVDIILVGDSLAMVALGHKTTLPLTLEEMLHHGGAVRRGVKRAFLVCD